MSTRIFISCLFIASLNLFACQSEQANEQANADAESRDQIENTDQSAEGSGTKYQVEPENSIIMWEGYKPGKTHKGIVQIKEGVLTIENDQVTGGKMVIDMTSITVKDLDPGDGKEKLEGHLRGTTEGKEDDFFNTTQYPEATFEITKTARLENDEAANTLIYGNLTIKGITKPVSFKAETEKTQNKFTARTAKFKIDRTKWDIKFMSKSFFDNLKDNFIEDEFGLTIFLVAEPQ